MCTIVSKKSSKLRVIGLCAWNSAVTGEFTAQRDSDAEMFPFDDVVMIWATPRSIMNIKSMRFSRGWLEYQDNIYEITISLGQHAYIPGLDYVDKTWKSIQHIETETKLQPFRSRYFKCIFVNEPFDIQVKSNLWSNWQRYSTKPDNGFAPSRRQAIIRTKDGLVYRRISVTRVGWFKSASIGFFLIC